MNENINRYDTEINLIDLFYYLLSQWKLLVIALVVGALLGTGIFVYKNNENAILSESLQQVSSEAILNNIDNSLIADMEIAAQYRDLYNKQLAYNNNSILMQLDPYNVYQGKIQYYINAGTNTAIVSELYKNILDHELANAIIASANIDAEQQYILELINCNVENIGDITFENAEIAYNLNATQSIVTFEVNTAEEEFNKLILETIINNIDKLNNDIMIEYGNFEVSFIEENVSMVVNNDIQSIQKSKIDLLNSYNNTFKTLEKNFTGDALEYYNLVYLDKEISEGTIDTAIPQENYFKWLLIGIFVGVMCWGCYGVFKYMIDKKIKTVDELKERYGLSIIGFINTSTSKNNVINLNRIKCNGNPDSIASIKTLIGDRTLLCLETDDEEVGNIIKQLLKDTKKNMVVNQLHQTIANIDNLDNIVEVILISKLYQTTYDDIEKDISICRLQNLKIKGMIIVA